MSAHKRLIAFLLLLGWLFANAHVAVEHGGVADGGGHHALVSDGDDDHHDDDGPAHDWDHHHDLTALAEGQSIKAARQQALAPVWLPLCNALVERLTAMLRESSAARVWPGREESPPDARASGWLLVCRSAQPVRGPSPV